MIDSIHVTCSFYHLIIIDKVVDALCSTPLNDTKMKEKNVDNQEGFVNLDNLL